jgi:hypothetical protein
MSTYIKDWECCGDTTHTQSWEPTECPFCNRLTDREKACVNLLANHDPAQVVVMGKASVAKVRETLHKLANICAWSGKVAGQEIAEQAIALLPLTSTPTEATAGDAVTCRNCNRPVNGEGDLCEKCACRSCGMLNPTGHMCCQPCE